MSRWSRFVVLAGAASQKAWPRIVYAILILVRSPTDLLLITLIADASQNGLAGEYKSILSGILLVSTIMFWSYHLDWLSHLIEPSRLPLIRNEKLLGKNMRRELITEEDLMSHLREQGLDDVGKVKEAFMEGDGRISVVQHEQKRQKRPDRKKI